jgi:hypothetical protein
MAFRDNRIPSRRYERTEQTWSVNTTRLLFLHSHSDNIYWDDRTFFAGVCINSGNIRNPDRMGGPDLTVFQSHGTATILNSWNQTIHAGQRFFVNPVGCQTTDRNGNRVPLINLLGINSDEVGNRPKKTPPATVVLNEAARFMIVHIINDAVEKHCATLKYVNAATSAGDFMNLAKPENFKLRHVLSGVNVEAALCPPLYILAMVIAAKKYLQYFYRDQACMEQIVCFLKFLKEEFEKTREQYLIDIDNPISLPKTEFLDPYGKRGVVAWFEEFGAMLSDPKKVDYNLPGTDNRPIKDVEVVPIQVLDRYFQIVGRLDNEERMWWMEYQNWLESYSGGMALTTSGPNLMMDVLLGCK